MDSSNYFTEHHFDNQRSWVTPTIPINPIVREGFSSTEHSERDPLEVEHWWGKPYIVSCLFSLTDRDYKSYQARIAPFSQNLHRTPGKDEWESKQCNELNIWLEHWPSGVRYDLYCLDGGAWDRPSNIGMFATLEEAITFANSVPKACI